MTTLFTLGLFTRSSELIAMRSCGISLLRISIPMLLLGAASSVLLLVNAEIVIPAVYPKRDYIERVLIKKQGANAFFKRNNIWFRSGEMIVQAQFFEPAEKTLKGVIIWTLDGNMNPKSRIDAAVAVNSDKRWILRQASVKDFSGGYGFTQSQVAEMEMALTLKVDDLKVLDNNADNLSFKKL
jgi:lipopolysaccharide export system permease protein